MDTLPHRCTQELYGGDMRNIVNEAGEIVAMVTSDGTLIGGHHGIAVAASLGKKLSWKDTGEPVNLEPFFRHHPANSPHAPATRR